jgi:hypothetical protein
LRYPERQPLVAEESMTASRRLSLALGLALAAPVAAYAHDGASKPVHHRHRAALRRATALAAAPPAAPVLGFWPPAYVASPEQHETDGLSRNPDDCVTYGCIDNN